MRAALHAARLKATSAGSIQFYWDDRNKLWEIGLTLNGKPTRWTRAETTSELDEAAMILLGGAIRAEMESWLSV